MLGVGLVCEEFADFVVGLDVGDGIRTGRFADRVLVDHLDRFQQIDISFDAVEIARFHARIVEHAPQGRVK